MSAARLNRFVPWLAALVLAAACVSSVFLPFTGASWNEVLGIEARLADWLPFLTLNAENNCTQPRAYWLANSAAWPLSELTLAGVTTPKEEAVRLLELTPNSSALEILTAELISAHLNRAHGADATLVDPLISETEAILAQSEAPEANLVSQDERILLLAQALADYNEGRVGPGGCQMTTLAATLSISPTPLVCTYSLAYWADHPEAWMQQEVQAGMLYTQPEALNFLYTSAASDDLSIRLTRHLIGLRLNLAAGLDLGDELSAVEYAEIWLQEHPIGVALDPETENDGRLLLMRLEKINNGETGPGLCLEAQTPTLTPYTTMPPTISPLPSATFTTLPTEGAEDSPIITATQSAEATATTTPGATQTSTPEPPPTPVPTLDTPPTSVPTPEGTMNCTHTAPFWLDHPQAWPVQDLSLGGQVYSKEQAWEILYQSGEEDTIYQLAQQLIAAKLNIEIGADGSAITGIIDQADEWLEEHPINSNPPERVRGEAITLAMSLEEYNSGLTGPGLCSDENPKPTPTPSIETPTQLPSATPTEVPALLPSATPTEAPAPTPTASETPEPPTATPQDTVSPTPDSPTGVPSPAPPASETPEPPTETLQPTDTPTPTI